MGCRSGWGSSSGAILMVVHLFPIQSLPDALMGHRLWVIPVLLQSQSLASASTLSVYLSLFPLVRATSICKGGDMALYPMVVSPREGLVANGKQVALVQNSQTLTHARTALILSTYPVKV